MLNKFAVSFFCVLCILRRPLFWLKVELNICLSQIKIRKCERKLGRRDLELIMENAGVAFYGKKKKDKESVSCQKKRKKKKGYRDSDDDEVDSQEEDFIASSTEESEDEKICDDVQKKIRKYVEKSGERLGARRVFLAPFIF